MRFWHRRSVFFIGATTTLVLVVAACGSSGSTSSSGSASSGSASSANAGQWDTLSALIAAAKKEGSLTLYTSNPDTVTKPAAAAFEAKYGIKVNWDQLSTGPMEQRFSSETSAGIHTADILMNTDQQFLDDQITAGNLTALDAAHIPGGFPPAGYPAAEALSDGKLAVASDNMIGFEINTTKVSASAAPSNWSDLLEPQWKGKISSLDPNQGGTYVFAMWDYLDNKYGDNFLKEFAAQKPTWTSAPEPSQQAVGAGEQELFFPAAGGVVAGLKQAGAPVQFIMPSDDTSTPSIIGLVAQAPHPAAARLWVYYITSRAGSKVYNSQPAQVSPYGGAGAPADFTPPRLLAASTKQRIAHIDQLLGLTPTS